MINAKQLLADLTRQLKHLEDDLRQRIFDHDELPELKAQLTAEWQAARDAERCAETFESWVEQLLTQAGVHWLLSGVFLRFIEDNALVDRPWVAGPPASGRLALAQDRHETYFRAHPLENDRDYLVAAFREAGALPGLQTFFDEAHNPVFRLPISGDAAMALRQFWQQVDPNTGDLAHDFTDASWNTRFLGDLYQDLSEATRKRYALLQTPDFVEEFILDRTLTPAIREFGYREVRLIDPTCGSGHFLLGAFNRLVAEWLKAEPGLNPSVIAKHALNAVAGVDLNPFAVAIARFRLWVAALKVAEVRRLADAPDFKVHVAIGDSLLHGSRFGLSETGSLLSEAETLAGYGLNHAYVSEDLAQVQHILGRQYHAVVGNPPYIVVKDAALNAAYRLKYPSSCHKKYSLGAPFTERFFELAVTGSSNGQRAGYVGLITANSFMKREFGSKLIEQVLPRLDLTHVVDTSGAYIPGHGTPTVLLFGRHRAPVDESVRTVMGIRGEPSTPEDPARGFVWSAIVDQVDRSGSESAWVSATDMPRTTFGKHPWSIGGGGAAELLELLNDSGDTKLGSLTTAIGRTTHTGEDSVFFVPQHWATRNKAVELVVGLVEGEGVRDFAVDVATQVVFPYDRLNGSVIEPIPEVLAPHFWRFRRVLRERSDFGSYIEDRGLKWYEHSMFFPERFLTSLGIAFAEVATHNHFVLDRGGKVFKQTAPVIKLPGGSSVDEHLGLLGLLNSSLVGFWLKQVSHQKQMMGGDGIRISEKSKVPYQFASTRVQELPMPPNWAAHPDLPRLIELAGQADTLATEMSSNSATNVVSQAMERGQSIRQLWDVASASRKRARTQLVLIQEEIDFLVYGMYGLVADRRLLTDNLDWGIEIDAGERPFCILSKQNVDGFAVPAEVPSTWPEDLRALWHRRMEAIRTTEALRVIEEPHYKRRWIGRQGLFNHGAKANELRDALAGWLLDRLEAPHLWPASADHPPKLTGTRSLADAVAQDPAFMQVAELYAGQAGFDVQQLVMDLVASESVPFLPVLRYSETGLRKRAQWAATWALQRQEDTIDAQVVADNADTWRAELIAQAKAQYGSAELTDAKAWIEKQLAAEIARQQAEEKAEKIGPIPVPPKYQSKDFVKGDFWRLRGGLDVPKERWISYPGCERGADGSTPLAWAGWNHLQQATALASYLLEMKDNEGWEPERLRPLLAGLDELVPWLKQWHNEPDAAFDGERMGDYYEGFVADQARELGFTLADLRDWKPTATAKRRGGRPRKATT